VLFRVIELTLCGYAAALLQIEERRHSRKNNFEASGEA